jgi:D-proline reductase (dithiol) PrdB
MRRPEHAVPYIDRTRELYAQQAPYRWVVNDRRTDPAPWTPIAKPLSALRISLIGSGGVHREDQEPFHFRNDTSIREISLDMPAARLRVSHFGYDFRDAQRDAGCVLPFRALGDLARDGVVGACAGPALSFMGGIYSARRVRDELAPALLDYVLRQKADLAYLVPA